jgi:tetratricopeptide (TPR) repeat protein
MSQRYLAPVSIAIMMALYFLSSPLLADESRDLVREGVQLHDGGNYQAAIAKYKKAIEANSSNAEAHYELASSYSQLEKYSLCISTVERGLKLESNIDVLLYAMKGSCQSAQGESEDALRSFRKGLKISPYDVSLNFNIAITLARQQETREAIVYLKRVIEIKPKYSSPYFILGSLFRVQGHRIPSIYCYMRFVMLEPDSGRSGHAARAIFKLLYLGVSEQSSNEMRISVGSSASTDEGDFSVLELALSLAAAAALTEEEQTKGEAQRAVDALETFVQISLEVADEDLADTFTWRYTGNNLLQLQRDNMFKTFAYLLAARAGISGASDWLKANSEDLKKLNAAISRNSE